MNVDPGENRQGLEELVETKVKEVIKNNNDELLQNISVMFNNFSQISASSSSSEFPVFKRKSNKEQFKQNVKVLESLEHADNCLKAERYEKARENIIQAKDMIKRRQKLNQLADSSELGWRVVTEYEQNPIASDSEDEKRIYKAEARASRKAKSEKVKKSKARNWPYRRPKQADVTVASSSSQGQQQQGYGRKPGLCFLCGKPGHWKNECTKTYTNNKISTNKNHTYLNTECTHNSDCSAVGCFKIDNVAEKTGSLLFVVFIANMCFRFFLLLAYRQSSRWGIT